MDMSRCDLVADSCKLPFMILYICFHPKREEITERGLINRKRLGLKPGAVVAALYGEGGEGKPFQLQFRT